MSTLTDSKKMLTRRAVIFGAANVAAMSVVMGRLYYLQFVHAEEYRNLSEGNRVKLQLIAPVRGLLLDRKGVELAANKQNFRLFLDTESLSNGRESLKKLAALLYISEERIAQVLA